MLNCVKGNDVFFSIAALKFTAYVGRWERVHNFLMYKITFNQPIYCFDDHMFIAENLL